MKGQETKNTKKKQGYGIPLETVTVYKYFFSHLEASDMFDFRQSIYLGATVTLNKQLNGTAS